MLIWMNWKLDNGPWTTVMEGTFRGHDVEILENPEHFFITIIYDTQDGKQKGALVEGQKALVARGPAEAFIQTMPKPAIVMEKTLGNKTFKLFFVSTESVYIDFKQEDYLRKVDNAIKKGYEDVETVKELARASSLQLIEIDMSPESEYSPIIGDPFTSRGLLSGLKKSALELIDLSGTTRSSTKTMIQLGLGKKREIIKEATENLSKTLVTGKGDSALYAMYILAENFLLENRTGIIFDNGDYFSGLGEASKNEMKLKEELVEFEPSGFPVKRYTAKKDLQISLGDSDLYLLQRLLTVGDESFAKTLTLEALKCNYDTPEELIKKIDDMEGLTDFQKLKAERILQIIKQNYSDLFGKGIGLKELTKKWPGNLGRATIINTKELTSEEEVLFVQTILRILDNEIKGERDDRIVLFIPESDKIISLGAEQIAGTISRLEGLGVGFVFGAERFSPQLDNTVSTTINVIDKKDVAVSVKGERNYRVILRPSLSGNPQP